jgi:single-strand DNA-binding protein
MNKVIIYGSIGEPKFRDVNTKNGVREICSFGICQPEGKDASGNTNFAWYNVDMWLDKGSKLRPFIVKGAKVIVDGELKTDKWKDKEGNDRSSIKIAGRNITLVGDRQEQASVSTPIQTTDDGLDEDLPDFLR